jgi:O-antigen ligase
LVATGFSGIQETLIFNMGGPIALGLSVFFLQRVVATGREVTQLIWVLIGPLVGVSALVAQKTISSGEISFTDNSNSTTSGGFGPNQVSLVLGLGALCCLLILLRGIRGRTGIFVLVLCGVFMGQTLLTFSRGGMYTALMGAAGIALTGLLTSGTRSKILTRALLIGIMSLLVISWANTFTGGSLGTRYADKGTTGRSNIAESEVTLFEQNPVWGVGPGQAAAKRVQDGISGLDGEASHTEYTRLFAEHGMLGVLAVGVLLAMAWRAFRGQTDRWGRLFAAGTLFWSLTALTHAGMRVGLIALVFALPSIRVSPGVTVAATRRGA